MAKETHTTPPIGVKVGRLRMPIAKAIGRKCADIYISDTQIEHIANKHRKELESLGFSAFTYVKMIVENFNVVMQGTYNSLLLVVYNGELNHVAAIDLNYDTKKAVWEVKTAQPREENHLKNKQVLWKKRSAPVSRSTTNGANVSLSPGKCSTRHRSANARQR